LGTYPGGFSDFFPLTENIFQLARIIKEKSKKKSGYTSGVKAKRPPHLMSLVNDSLEVQI